MRKVLSTKGDNINTDTETTVNVSKPTSLSAIVDRVASTFVYILLSLLYYLTLPVFVLYSKITGTDKLERLYVTLQNERKWEFDQMKKRVLSQQQRDQLPILVLDLDETLLHSSLQAPEPQYAHLYQYSLNVYVDHVPCTFYVSERPYLKNFMKRVCDWYRVVIFTASVKHYADPVIDRLYYSDKISARYFRDSCKQFEGMFIKDLNTVVNQLCGSENGLKRCVIIDNSPISYLWHQENAIPCVSWMADNDNDQELLNLLPFLEALRFTADVRNVLRLRLSN
jgi:Dullard-like phosphatase family protein